MSVEIVSADDVRRRGPARRGGGAIGAACGVRLPQPRLPDGKRRRLPFILQPMRIRRGWIAPPAMQLIYSRDIADYAACAGAIGRALIRAARFRWWSTPTARWKASPASTPSARAEIFQGSAPAGARGYERYRTRALRAVDLANRHCEEATRNHRSKQALDGLLRFARNDECAHAANLTSCAKSQ